MKPLSVGIIGAGFAGFATSSRNAPEKIYALGSLLFGERLETPVVPEIRQQAVDIAEQILRGAP